MDYLNERNTIIEDGSFSVLSIFPVGISNADARNNLLHVKEMCNSQTFPFVKRIKECPMGHPDRKSKTLLHCSCFDVVDSFVGEQTIKRYLVKKGISFWPVLHQARQKETSEKYKEATAIIRIYLGTTYIYWCSKCIRVDIFLKLFTLKNVGILNFNLSLGGLTVQQVIALRHRLESETEIKDDGWTDCFSSNIEVHRPVQLVKGAAKALFSAIGSKIASAPKKKSMRYGDSEDPLVESIVDNSPVYNMQSVIELRKIGDFTESALDAHSWAMEHSQMIYGLISGDEGIGFIPDRLAQERLSNHWGSRDFLDSIAFGKNVLVLNAKTTSTIGKDYMDYQEKWNIKYDGGQRRIQYFLGKPCMAGFDHGILHAVERNMVIAFYYNFIDKQGKTNSKKLNKQRQQLISFINSSLSPIDEINEMYDMISRASGIDKSIGQVRNKLNIQSEEMNIDYQYKNNGIILFLTVFSLAVAIVAIQKDTFFLSLKPWYISLISIVLITVVIVFLSVSVTNYFSNNRRR